MTKILYIPTGLYLEFNTFNKETKPEYDVENSGIPDIDKLMETILSLSKTEYNTSNVEWARNNNIQFPIIKEDFEIHYD